MGTFMRQASKEELTLEGLPRPTRAYRAYNSGTRLSEELQRQQLRRHAWDGYVGARVRVRWDAASDGVLRWVGTVQQYGTPRQLYAGVEWRVAPAQREVGVVGRWLLCRRGEAPESGPGAFHRGDVDGEHLFDLADDDTVATCERVEDVVFCSIEPSRQENWSTSDSRRYGSTGTCAHAPLSPFRELNPPSTPRLMSARAALLRCFGLHLLLLGPIRFVIETTAVVSPMALKWYIYFLKSDTFESGNITRRGSEATANVFSFKVAGWLSYEVFLCIPRTPAAVKGLLSVVFLFALSLVHSLAQHKYGQLVHRCAYAARSALSSCVAEKCLRIAAKDLKKPELNVGRIINLVASDVNAVESLFNALWMMVTVPLQLCAAVYLLHRSMGPAAYICVVMLAVALPLQVLLIQCTSVCTRNMAQTTDARLRCTNEFLAGIRPIKLMGLEEPFEREINRRRTAELYALRKYQLVYIANALLTRCIPSCTTAAVMIAYYHSGNAMSPSVIYPALSLLALMETPFQLTTYLIGVYSQFFVSMRRLTSFLAADDAAARDVLEEVEAAREADSAAAVFAHATISSYKPVPLPTPSWRRDDGEPHFELRVRALLTDVDLRIPRGRLTVVLGPTGSGKSTLLDSLIGATYLIGVYSQFFVSMRRLTSFLAADDAAARDVLEEVEAAREADSAAAVFAHATISSYKPVPLPTPSWRRDDGEPHFELRVRALLTDVDLRIPRGRLTVVLGPTGSGKSTLLDSLIGALAVTRGRVACSRSVAYVPQQPWIMSATLRDNVVFFGAADAAAFERAVASSQLAADLALLADGAETEIGERGINLSGGQKARVSLARAVYADRDVYVLDDPLSALDAHVGERVMRECVCGALARKTRVLATHQVSAAAYADYVVLLQDGRVAFQGTYAAYRQYARLHYDRSISGLGSTSMYAAHTVSELGSAVDLSRLNDLIDGSTPQCSVKETTTADEFAARCYDAAPSTLDVFGDFGTEAETNVAITDSGEEKAVGAVPLDVYRRYMAACGGWPAFSFLIAFFIFTEAVVRSSEVWLSLWSGDKLEGISSHRRLTVYVGALLAAIFVSPSRDLLCFTDMRRASYHLHANLLRSIEHAKLVFFDVTPRGRLMNRMSRDMAQIDWDLPVNLDVSFFFFCYLVAYMIIMTVSQPFILVILVPCIFVYSRIFRFFCTANREMQRLLNISNSPVFAVLNEVLTGRWTICTYERQQNMMQEVLRSLDGVFACGYTQCMGARWLAVRVELLGNVAVSSLALLGVVASQSSWLHINLGLLALSVSKASSITAVLSRFITVGASVEASMNCVERVLYYTDNAPAEDVGDDVAAAGV
ncbi:ATP-binding cassette protein subfamily C member 1, partial [Lotmaria passim]